MDETTDQQRENLRRALIDLGQAIEMSRTFGMVLLGACLLLTTVPLDEFYEFYADDAPLEQKDW